MPQTVRDVMSANPVTFSSTTTLSDAARAMRDRGIGDVLVERDGQVCGIVTDRDIVVRAIAEGRDPGQVRLGDIASMEMYGVDPAESVDEAARVMRERALRRLPVVENNRVIGILSLGDLAIEHDRRSALADISAAPPNT